VFYRTVLGKLLSFSRNVKTNLVKDFAYTGHTYLSGYHSPWHEMPN